MNAVLIIAVGLGGLAVGSLFHAWISKEVAATKTELQGWAQRLRVAIDKDAATARTEFKAIVAEIEKKF